MSEAEGKNSPAGKGPAFRLQVLIPAVSLVTLAVLMLITGIDRLLAEENPERVNPGLANGLPLPTTTEDFFLPGTQPETLDHPIVNPASCDLCHSDPIYSAWRGSMMSQAGRDPVFWAAFAVANDDATDSGEYCLRCHTPMGWYAGRSSPADGSALSPEDIGAGVACEVCHRMVDPVPGANDEVAGIDAGIRSALTSPPPANHFGSAMLILDPQDRRRGPFSFPTFAFHERWQAQFQGQDDARAASRLCGSCHNVDNPALSWTENPPGGGPAQYWPNQYNTAAPSFGPDKLFPIERTYEEWLYSAYPDGVYAPQFAGAKLDGIVASCQDCHMVRQTGTAAESSFNPVFRDCNTTGCLPAHILAGGNSWVPKIIQNPLWRLSNPADAPALDQTALEARSMLRRAASLQLSLDEGGPHKVLTVRVINETGHKLPTGYPEGRRMWINVRAFDAGNKLVYESGAYNPSTGVLTKDPDIKVYEVEQGLTPKMGAQTGLPAGPSFHFLLNNTTYKDNRIPPRGYTVAAFDRPGMRPVGAVYANGQYWDDTEYELPDTAVRFVVTLYYQLASKEYIDFLRTSGGPDGDTLGELWDDSKSPPEIVAQALFPVPNVNYVPISRGK